MLNEAKVSHNEVHAFGSKSCRLFQSALNTVFYGVFFNSVFTVTLMCAGLPYVSMPAHAHSAVPTPPPALLSVLAVFILCQ